MKFWYKCQSKFEREMNLWLKEIGSFQKLSISLKTLSRHLKKIKLKTKNSNIARHNIDSFQTSMIHFQWYFLLTLHTFFLPRNNMNHLCVHQYGQNVLDKQWERIVYHKSRRRPTTTQYPRVYVFCCLAGHFSLKFDIIIHSTAEQITPPF